MRGYVNKYLTSATRKPFNFVFMETWRIVAPQRSLMHHRIVSDNTAVFPFDRVSQRTYNRLVVLNDLSMNRP